MKLNSQIAIRSLIFFLILVLKLKLSLMFVLEQLNIIIPDFISI